ncbi:MAG: HEAT repeat domain-containing protein [Candidatus Thorarchaeota archaeon]
MSTRIRSLLLEFETDEVGKLARMNAKNKTALVKAFSDTSDIVRERALIASIDLADPEVVADVAKALDDDVTDVRIAAAQALAFYHQPRTIPILFKGLKDDSTWVRSHCAVGLSKLLNGPIWARLSAEDIEKFLDDFPEMTDEDINRFLSSIKLNASAIDRFMNWRGKGFDIEIDVSTLVEELESAPILISEEAIAAADVSKTAGLTDEVEEILSELPEEILSTLPPEDIKRLTPASARELVQKLKVSIPSATPKKKKTVKVRKVKKVKKKKKPTEIDELISKLPAEVRSEIGDETLASLSVEELEALLASSPEPEEPELEPEPEDEPIDPRKQSFIEKYGEEKAELLITIPEVMLEGIPEEQIEEMDLETLKGLTQALEPRE